MPLFRRAGKHEKPSAAPKAAIATGMTAAFLLGDAASASAAAPSSEWDRLAQCESGGNWSINTGNGYYGGLQFNLATWRGVGGTGMPHENSRNEQIRRANILHDSRGFSPWPACSRKLGLRSGTADVPAATADETVTRTTERASRARRSAPKATAPKTVAKTVVPIAGKYQASSRQKVVVALATVAPPRFDGRTLSVADRDVYRIATKHWQRRMVARGWDLSVDGRFGPQSASVAQRFAAQKGLKAAAPGTVDKAVWDAAWALPVS